MLRLLLHDEEITFSYIHLMRNLVPAVFVHVCCMHRSSVLCRRFTLVWYLWFGLPRLRGAKCPSSMWDRIRSWLKTSGEGTTYLKYSPAWEFMGQKAWQATVHGAQIGHHWADSPVTNRINRCKANTWSRHIGVSIPMPVTTDYSSQWSLTPSRKRVPSHTPRQR